MKNSLAAGFTLIELLVVSAIIAIVVGGSIAGYVQFKEYQDLVVAGRGMQDAIKLAQNLTRIRVVKNCDTTPGSQTDDFQGYRAVVNNAKVEVFALCGTTAATAAVVGGAVSTYNVPDGTSVTYDYGGNTPVNFDFFTIQSRQAPSIGTNQIVLSTTRNAYTISISSTGVISGVISRI